MMILECERKEKKKKNERRIEGNTSSNLQIKKTREKKTIESRM